MTILRSRILLPLSIHLCLVMALGIPREIKCENQQEQSRFSIPDFDVVAIREHRPEQHDDTFEWTATSFLVRNGTLIDLIAFAYDKPVWLVKELPGWATTTTWDIQAKTMDSNIKLSTIPLSQRRLLVASVLEKRFLLKAAIELKTTRVLALRKSSSTIKVEQVGPVGKVEWRWHSGDGEIDANRMTMERLAYVLSVDREKTVLDQTGLEGERRFHLRWTPDDQSEKPIGDDPPPPLPVALKEQLGLTLVPIEAPVATLIVKQLERPQME